MNILATMPGMFENSWHDFYKFRERVVLKQWFSTGDHFGAPPQGTSDHAWRHFSLSQVRGCRRLLVERGAATHHTQGGCSQQSLIWPQMPRVPRVRSPTLKEAHQRIRTDHFCMGQR